MKDKVFGILLISGALILLGYALYLMVMIGEAETICLQNGYDHEATYSGKIACSKTTNGTKEIIWLEN